MIQNITCAQCQCQNTFEVPIKVSSFVCSTCHSLNKWDDDNWKSYGAQSKILSDLPLFQKATIDKKTYFLTGIILKKASLHYKWKEYILNAEDCTTIILSESDGHWILMKPIEDRYDISKLPILLDYNQQIYRLYDNCQAITKELIGCFDFDPVQTNWNVYSYVYKTDILSIEGNNSEEESYEGRHLPFSELRGYFPHAKRKFRTGIGIVQPTMIDTKNAATIGFVTIVLMLLLQIYFHSNQKGKELYQEKMVLTPSVKDKELSSPNFILTGASAPLGIDIRTSLDNNWATINVALVNELTSETQYASQDIEYYHGVEGGESWGEGNQNKKFNFCGIPAGKYHLIISPSFDISPIDTLQDLLTSEGTIKKRYPLPVPAPTEITIKATWQATNNNIIIFSITLVILSIIALIGGRIYNREKWRNSDYSPYNYEN